MKVTHLKKRMKGALISSFPYDERTIFRDLSKIKVERRTAKSKILNFYSSNNNIGNYTPVMGIRHLLDDEFDTWCAHRNVDWNFVNSSYDKVIIGGAGLFHKSFENFWVDFINYCKVPSIVWGVGGIFPKDSTLEASVGSKILNEALRRCDFVNLRDNLSANYVNLENIHISPCPTVALLEEHKLQKKVTNQLLYSSHEELLNAQEKENLKKILDENVSYVFTKNIQTRFNGLNRILDQYKKSKLVITTRLHGAIIAYGLGIPYLAVSFDNKIDEFHTLYGNGKLVKNLKELKEIDLEDLLENSSPQEPELSAVEFFAKKIKREWIHL